MPNFGSYFEEWSLRIFSLFLATLPVFILAACAPAPLETPSASDIGVPAETLSSVTETSTSDMLPLDPGELYYYINRERIPLALSLDWIALRVVDDQKETQILEIVSGLVDEGDETLQIPYPRTKLVRLPPRLSSDDVVKLINTLRSNVRGSAFVNPVFSDESALLILTDEFIANFPSDMPDQEISAINSMNHVEVIETLLGQPRFFVLRVLPGSRMDSLAMANYYCEQLGVAAEPNFLRLQSGPTP
ncbi:MAG: hypothetical protein KIS80_09660 [Anaerolineales bacterium]|nr:hypothetical protein [Anaerolineales bacterium]